MNLEYLIVYCKFYGYHLKMEKASKNNIQRGKNRLIKDIIKIREAAKSIKKRLMETISMCSYFTQLPEG